VTEGILEIAAADYHTDQVADVPTLSSSICKTLVLQSPAHAWAAHPKLNPNFSRVKDPRFDVGNVFHQIMLEGRQAIEIVEAADWRSNLAKAVREQARAAGRTPLLASQWEEVELMRDAVCVQLGTFNVDPPVFVLGRAERTLVWEDIAGVVCRARLDWLHDDGCTIDDLKTTSASGNPDRWGRQTIYAIGSDIQAAFYMRGLRKLTDARETAFRFVICETSPPFATSLVQPSRSLLDLADRKVEYAIDLWARCLESDEWPGYPRDAISPPLTLVEEAKWMERETRGMVH